MTRPHPPAATLTLLAAGLLALVAVGCQSEPPPAPAADPVEETPTVTRDWGPFQFSTPVEFSDAHPVGLDAVAFVLPADATLGEARFEISLAVLSRGMMEAMEQDETGLFEYGKTTFLGLGGPADDQCPRTIMGGNRVGEVFQHSIPRASTVEAHLVPLTNGDFLLLGLKADAEMPADEAERIRAAVCASLTEQAPPAE